MKLSDEAKTKEKSKWQGDGLGKPGGMSCQIKVG